MLPSVFGFTPPHVADGRDWLLDMVFAVAINTNAEMLVPFVCVDSRLDAGIMFPENCFDQSDQELIASAFWSLLLRHRGELSEFEAKGISWCHPDGYDTQVRVGLRDGTYYAWDEFPLVDVDT